MKNKMLGQIEKLLDHPNTLELALLNTLLKIGIPFNKPHGLNLVNISKGKVWGEAAYKRVNKNHLGGMHACALATIGEYVSGTALLTELSSTTYRFILKTLRVDYQAQAKSKVLAKCQLVADDVKKWKEALKVEGKIFVPLVAVLETEDGKQIAEVHTQWQLKEWSQVKFKN